MSPNLCSMLLFAVSVRADTFAELAALGQQEAQLQGMIGYWTYMGVARAEAWLNGRAILTQGQGEQLQLQRLVLDGTVTADDMAKRQSALSKQMASQDLVVSVLNPINLWHAYKIRLVLSLYTYYTTTYPFHSKALQLCYTNLAARDPAMSSPLADTLLTASLTRAWVDYFLGIVTRRGLLLELNQAVAFDVWSQQFSVRAVFNLKLMIKRHNATTPHDAVQVEELKDTLAMSKILASRAEHAYAVRFVPVLRNSFVKSTWALMKIHLDRWCIQLQFNLGQFTVQVAQTQQELVHLKSLQINMELLKVHTRMSAVHNYLGIIFLKRFDGLTVLIGKAVKAAAPVATPRASVLLELTSNELHPAQPTQTAPGDFDEHASTTNRSVADVHTERSIAVLEVVMRFERRFRQAFHASDLAEAAANALNVRHSKLWAVQLQTLQSQAKIHRQATAAFMLFANHQNTPPPSMTRPPSAIDLRLPQPAQTNQFKPTMYQTDLVEQTAGAFPLPEPDLYSENQKAPDLYSENEKAKAAWEKASITAAAGLKTAVDAAKKFAFEGAKTKGVSWLLAVATQTVAHLHLTAFASVYDSPKFYLGLAPVLHASLNDFSAVLSKPYCAIPNEMRQSYFYQFEEYTDLGGPGRVRSAATEWPLGGMKTVQDGAEFVKRAVDKFTLYNPWVEGYELINPVPVSLRLSVQATDPWLLSKPLQTLEVDVAAFARYSPGLMSRSQLKALNPVFGNYLVANAKIQCHKRDAPKAPDGKAPPQSSSPWSAFGLPPSGVAGALPVVSDEVMGDLSTPITYQHNSLPVHPLVSRQIENVVENVQRSHKALATSFEAVKSRLPQEAREKMEEFL